MPTLPDYPGVSRIRNESPGLPYGWPILPDKYDFEPFLRLCSTLRSRHILFAFKLGATAKLCLRYIGLYTRPKIKSWPDVKFCAHAHCVLPRCSSWVTVRFTMAVDFSCIQKELLGYVPLGFKQARNFTVEKVKTIPPLTLQPNIANTQGSLPLFTRITTCYSWSLFSFLAAFALGLFLATKLNYIYILISVCCCLGFYKWKCYGCRSLDEAVNYFAVT